MNTSQQGQVQSIAPQWKTKSFQMENRLQEEFRLFNNIILKDRMKNNWVNNILMKRDLRMIVVHGLYEILVLLMWESKHIYRSEIRRWAVWVRRNNRSSSFSARRLTWQCCILDNINERNGQIYRIKGPQEEDKNYLEICLTGENKPFNAQKKIPKASLFSHTDKKCIRKHWVYFAKREL